MRNCTRIAKAVKSTRPSWEIPKAWAMGTANTSTMMNMSTEMEDAAPMPYHSVLRTRSTLWAP